MPELSKRRSHEDPDMTDQPHIHCPLCLWEPKAESRWICAPGEPGSGCRTSWHTFWTAGCCPGCGHFWTMTACHACKKSSPHESWYHFPEKDDIRKDVEEEVGATA
ncbi:MAG: hypothetical protein GAK28_02786 [Luteibacter sp.]|nr:MAG: hypothetical protein GAK28_02786 [Luteibacter sp.]